MTRVFAVGFGLATAFAAVMVACGGDDSGSTPGTSGSSGSGTAGSGSGTAGSGNAGTSSTGTSGSGGSNSAGGGSGVGGGFSFDGGGTFDGSLDLDAFFSGFTCAQLTACCPKLPAQAQAGCTMVAGQGDDANCSAAMNVYQLGGLCK